MGIKQGNFHAQHRYSAANVKMLVQKRLHLILYNILGIVFCSNQVYEATSCQVYPSEYAYQDNSVTKHESASANCRRYARNLHPNVSHNYTHCNGTHLQLTDSNFGQEPYQYTDYYWWTAMSVGKLLLIFPTRVSLTTITLHYYSGDHRGLPRLRFYAVPDDFDVWCGQNKLSDPTYVDVAAVPSDGEPAGRRNISINVNFNTMRVLMYKFSSSISYFLVSEVEFVTCTEGTTTSTIPTSEIPTSSIEKPDNTTTFPEGFTTATTLLMVPATTNSSTKSMRTSPSSATDPMSQSNDAAGIIAIGASIVILLVLSTILVPLLVWSYKRRSAKQKLYNDSSYSTLSRGPGQQIQLPSIHHNSAELYDQIHLSPSTGQTEYIQESESANINTPSQPWQNSHPTYSTSGDNRTVHSSALIAANRATMSQLSPQNSTGEQPIYAAVDKSKESEFKKQTKKEDSKCKAAEKGSPYRSELPSASMQEKKEKVEEAINPSHRVEELYTAVKKKPKGSEPKDEEDKMPPIPPHTVEELYTAVEKKPKNYVDENKETSSQTFLQSTSEDLYTAVIKKLKGGLTDGTEAAPPIPPHTVEELYTAVIKKPKKSAEDKEEAPPIPPYTMDEN